MKKLTVPFITGSEADQTITGISSLLDTSDSHALDQAPWPAFAYKPGVRFAVAHANDRIFIKYYVQEQTVRALYSHTNEPVYKDSCVEFFVSFDNTSYYNFEFNCIGTCLAGFGNGRHHRSALPPEIIRRLKIMTVVDRSGSDENDDVKWQLTVVIPVTVFSHYSIDSLQGKTCSCNFYKCGDDLEQPHYLCWNKIDSPEPDFHLPGFFGAVIFV